MRGGSKDVWNFSENSSNLVAGPFPQCQFFQVSRNPEVVGVESSALSLRERGTCPLLLFPLISGLYCESGQLTIYYILIGSI